jgi:hypothetical protein
LVLSLLMMVMVAGLAENETIFRFAAGSAIGGSSALDCFTPARHAQPT